MMQQLLTTERLNASHKHFHSGGEDRFVEVKARVVVGIGQALSLIR